MGIAETPTIDRSVKSRSGGLILQQNPGSTVPTFRGNTIKVYKRAGNGRHARNRYFPAGFHR